MLRYIRCNCEVSSVNLVGLSPQESHGVHVYHVCHNIFFLNVCHDMKGLMQPLQIMVHCMQIISLQKVVLNVSAVDVVNEVKIPPMCTISNPDSDFIQVHDGGNPEIRLDTLCHSTPPFHIYYSTFETITVKFRSNGADSGNGFKFHWDVFSKY